MSLEGRALGNANGLEGCALACGFGVLYKMCSDPPDGVSVLVKETQGGRIFLSRDHTARGRFPL